MSSTFEIHIVAHGEHYSWHINEVDQHGRRVTVADAGRDRYEDYTDASTAAREALDEQRGDHDLRTDLQQLTKEFQEVQAAYLSARDTLYRGIRRSIAGGVPKSHVASITGISRPTIDRIIADHDYDQIDPT